MISSRALRPNGSPGSSIAREKKETGRSVTRWPSKPVIVIVAVFGASPKMICSRAVAIVDRNERCFRQCDDVLSTAKGVEYVEM
jgi:hypothetical protein